MTAPPARRRWLHELAWLVGTMGAALLAATIALRLWRADWHVPFIGGVDGTAADAAVKTVIDTGWFLDNPLLGAPHGQHLQDFGGYTGDALQWFFVKVLAIAIPDAAVLTNLYYFLGYAMVAGAAYLALRYFRVAPAVAAAAGVVYAILPYHFERAASGHLMLANYMAAPAAGVLVMRALLGRPFVARRAGATGWRAWCTPENVGAVLACVLVGLASLYYAVFTLILLVLVAVVRVAVDRSWRGLLPAIPPFVITAVLLVFNVLPGLLSGWQNGPNAMVATRLPLESEVFSFSLTQLLVPVPAHIFAPFASLQSRYDVNQAVHGETGAELGLLLAVTLIVAMGLLLVWALRRGSGRTPGAVTAAAAGAALISFLLGTYGGISELIALVISPQIRVWSRLAPFLAFFLLVLLAVGLGRLRGWLDRRTGGRVAGGALLVAVAVVALLDQSSSAFVPDYQADAAAWNASAAFVQRIEQTVPPGSAILQLPLQVFPESGPVGGIMDYDDLNGYLHSNTLRWSFGAEKGRPEDWSSAQKDLPLRYLIPDAAAAGFAGAWIDLRGYPEGGAPALAQIRRAAGADAPTFTSPDGSRVFVGFGPLLGRLRAAHSPAQLQVAASALVNPTTLQFGAGTYPVETDATSYWYWQGQDARVTVTNPTSRSRRVRLASGLHSAPGSQVTIRSGGTTVFDQALASGDATLRLWLDVPPGGLPLDVHSTAPNLAAPPEQRDLRLQWLAPRVDNPQVRSLG